MKAFTEHWNSIYRETEDHRLGWYESDPSRTLDMLDQIQDWQHSRIFLPGAGTSVLVDVLLAAGAHLILNDISMAALERIRSRLGERAEDVEWFCGNIGHPLGHEITKVDIWIDRAVLHFLTVEEEIQCYFDNVASKVKVGGYALFAEFPPHGVPKCAGLELHRYSLDELFAQLGADYTLIDHFDHTYINPAGDPRPYIYALFRREK